MATELEKRRIAQEVDLDTFFDADDNELRRLEFFKMLAVESRKVIRHFRKYLKNTKRVREIRNAKQTR
jgi:hypothetical protein